MLKYILPRNAARAVRQVVSALFQRARKRLFNKETGEKGIRFGSSVIQKPTDYRYDLSLRGLFESAAKAEGIQPNEQLYQSVEHGVDDYLKAHEELANAKVLNAVQSYLTDSEHGRVPKDPEKVLGEVLNDVFGKVTENVANVVDTESTKSRNISTLDAISKISAVNGVTDPTVFFAGPVDGNTCKDCLRMYFLEDEITPRVWKTSELKSGYWKRGGSCPCIGGLHPHCRHALCGVLIGYGFKGGKLSFIEPGYDVWEDQRSNRAA